MVTRIEKREISSRLKGYTSLLLGISSVSLLAVPAFAQEDFGTPIESEPASPAATELPAELSYDRALQELMKTKAHSEAAAQWGKPRKVQLAPGTDPQKAIEKEIIKAPGVLGLQAGTPDPTHVQPIKINGDLSKIRKVSLGGKNAAAAQETEEEGGWDWVGKDKQQAQSQQQETATEVSEDELLQQAAVQPVSRPAAQPKKTTGFTTVFDATTGTGLEKVKPAAQVNAIAEESSAPSPGGGDEEEEEEQPETATTTESEEEAPKSAAQTAKEAVSIYNSAVKLHLAGKLDEAINEYRAALAANGELSQAHCNLGLIFNQQHDYDKALIEFRKALAIDPKDAITYNGIGAALRAQKDMAGAIENWSAAVRIDPKLATAHYNLGTVYEIQKDYDKAVQAYSEAVKNDFRLGEAHYRLGLILVKKNRIEDAKEQFSKALQVSKNAEYTEDARKRLAALEAPPATR